MAEKTMPKLLIDRALSLAGFMATAALVIAASSPTSAADVVLKVWDFKSADPVVRPYIDHVVEGFEAQHPGVTVEHVMQPHDQYYSILGTAIGAKSGPDIVLIHGGTNGKERADAFVPLDDKIDELQAALVGWDAFMVEGKTFAVPITLQGFALYYNKALYLEAGLDPDDPPQTWAELVDVCDAVMSETSANCFTMGDKEGFGVTWLLNVLGADLFSPEELAQFELGELPWTDPRLVEIFERVEDANERGWFGKGSNSTAMFPDSFEVFMRGDAANVLGLVSDTANWAQFEDFLGQNQVGTAMFVSLKDSPAQATMQRFPVQGGIGFAMTNWSQNQDLALDYVRFLSQPENLRIFFESAGAIVSDKNFDQSEVESPGAQKIFEWIGCCGTLPMSALTTVDGYAELKRQGQLLLNGETTPTAMVEALQVTAAQN